MGFFSDTQWQLTPQSLVNLAEIRTRPRYYRCPGCPGKYEKDPIKNEGARVLTRFSPTLTLWELSVAMETRVPI